jgi:glycosyltransferase involved in cell wall biosynthesis
MTRISVIIPCYNHGATIGRCLDSLFAQSLKPHEIIVVNDGSTDGSSEILQPYAGRVKIIDQENRGGPSARNRGFRESAGDLVMFCDADAVMRPDALAKMAAALEAHPEAAYAYSSFRFGWKKFPCGSFDPDRMRKMNFITTTSLIRRPVFPGFDESLKRFQDWDLWLTMLERGHAGVWVPETLFWVVPRKKEGISSWAPSFLYRLPWKALGFKPRLVEKYEDAAAIIRKKHHLP